jgi:hypothetical protein
MDTSLSRQTDLDVDHGPGEGEVTTLYGRDSTRERVEETVLGGVSEWHATYVFAGHRPVCLVGTQREFSESSRIAIWRRDLRVAFEEAHFPSISVVDSGRVDSLTEADRRALAENLRRDVDSLRLAISRWRAGSK